MEKIKSLFEKSLIGTRLFNIVTSGTLALATLRSWMCLFFVICLIVAITDKGKE